MTRLLVRLALVCSCLGTLSAHAQDKGYWRAVSKTARSITGDLTLGDTRVSLNFSTFAVADIRTLQPVEASAVFSDLDGATAAGHLYRLSIAGSQKFLHKESLCAGDDVQWMLTAVEGKTLRVAFFSGAAMPQLTAEAIANTTALCGTYTYSR